MSEAVLKEVMDRMAERIDALLGGVDVAQVDVRMIVSDLDFDPVLVKRQMHNLANVALALAVAGQSRPECCLLADVLLQAFATGIMHERVRVEHERRQG